MDQENNQCLNLEATSETIEWEPYSTCFEEQEQGSEQPTLIPIAQRNIIYLASEDYEISDTIERKLNSSSIKTNSNEFYVKPEDLAAKWDFGKSLAEAKIKATTKCYTRSAVHPIDRHFRTRNTTLKHNALNCRFTSDTFTASTPSILRNTCAQLFISDLVLASFVLRK